MKASKNIDCSLAANTSGSGGSCDESQANDLSTIISLSSGLSFVPKFTNSISKFQKLLTATQSI